MTSPFPQFLGVLGAAVDVAEVAVSDAAVATQVTSGTQTQAVLRAAFVAQGSVVYLPPPSGDATGATDTARMATAVAALPLSTEPGSVGYPQGTIQLANAPRSNPYYFGNLPNFGPHVAVVGRGERSTYITHVNSQAGVCLLFYGAYFESHTNPVPPESTKGGGACLDLTIDGSSATAGSTGLRYGDTVGFRHRVTVRHYNQAGSVGINQHTMVKNTEKTIGESWVYDNTTNFLIDCGFADGTTTIASSVTLPAASIAVTSWPASFAVPYGGQTGAVPGIYVNSQFISYTGVTVNGDGTATLTGCTGGSGSLTAGMTVQNGSTGSSHGYNRNSITIGASAGQDGVVIAGGANYYHGDLKLRGNFEPAGSAQTNAVVRITGQLAPGTRSNPAGGNTYGSLLKGCRLDVLVENNGLGSFAPYTFAFGPNGNSVQGCHGLIHFTGALTWQGTTGITLPGNTGQFRFAGFIVGDPVLNPDTTANPGPIMRGAITYNRVGVNAVSGTISLNDGDFAYLSLSANVTIGFNSPAPAPQRKVIIIKQASSGGPYTVTWPVNGSPSTTSPTVLWSGNAAPTMPTTPGAQVVVHLDTIDGATWYGRVLDTSTSPPPSLYGQYVPQRTKYGKSEWYGVTGVPASATLAPGVTGRLYGVPVALSATGTTVAMGVNITVAGSADATLTFAIRQDDGTVNPMATGGLLGTSAAMPANVTGFQSTALAVAIPTPGLYWLEVLCLYTTTAPTMTALNGQAPGLPRPNGSGFGYAGYFASGLGAVPTNLGTGWAWMGTAPDMMVQC